MIIGCNIIYDQVKELFLLQEVVIWYEKVFEVGVLQVGVIFVCLVLEYIEQFDSNVYVCVIVVLFLLVSCDDYEV